MKNRLLLTISAPMLIFILMMILGAAAFASQSQMDGSFLLSADGSIRTPQDSEKALWDKSYALTSVYDLFETVESFRDQDRRA